MRRDRIDEFRPALGLFAAGPDRCAGLVCRESTSGTGGRSGAKNRRRRCELRLRLAAQRR